MIIFGHSGSQARRRSPAHTPRFTAKWCIGRAGAPSSLCPSRAPLSCSTCGVFGLRPNAAFSFDVKRSRFDARCSPLKHILINNGF